MTVDSHIHFWDPASTPQPWMTETHVAINRPFGAADIAPRPERNGIDAGDPRPGAPVSDSDTDDLFAAAARDRVDRRCDRLGAIYCDRSSPRRALTSFNAGQSCAPSAI